MKKNWCALCLSAILLLAGQGTARAEGFAMNEWSARGLSLAGGMVARADDPSALAYNAAGITQLPGTHLMLGASIVSPYGSITGEDAATHQNRTMQTKVQSWTPAHFYLTHQLNDNVWLGLGSFTRFGLGLSYDGSWMGRYDVYDLALQSVSVVPTVAYKVNDWLSLSVGAELMYASLYMGKKAPVRHPLYGHLGDMDSQVEAHGYAGGYQLGAHVKLNDQWSLGLAYKSQVSMTMYGDIDFGGGNPYQTALKVKPNLKKSDAEGTVVMPDSLAFGVSYKPLDNLSFEVGTVWTRWSTYDHLNMTFDGPYGEESKSRKDFQDGWNFNASVEWKPLDWWALRAGVYYETPVVNEDYADFMMPTYGRTGLTAGMGFKWENFTLDLAYAHLIINQLDYSTTRNEGVTAGVKNAKSEDCVANIYSLSLGYTF